MKRLNRGQQFAFCDFSSPDIDATSILGAHSKLGRVIHARQADGNVITGIEVFREMWDAGGLGLLTKLSRHSFVEPLLFRAYGWFAQNRFWLTGRANPCQGVAYSLRH